MSGTEEGRPLDLDLEVGAPEDTAGAVRPDEVAQLLTTLGKCVRAHQIYETKNPVYQRFVGAMGEAFQSFFRQAAALALRVEEDHFSWQGNRFAVGEGRESLPFLFFKDGIRYLTFRDGFQDEVARFLEVVHRAKQVEQVGDDLITLLWEADFDHFQYGYVDQLAETVEVPEPGTGARHEISLDEIAQEIQEAQAKPQPEAGAPAPQREGISREDFEETLYFLDEGELEKLRQELDREWGRDVKTDVLNALFDRLEDPNAQRQRDVLGVLHQLLPVFLARGELRAASSVLIELQALLDQGGTLAADAAELADALIDELSEPKILDQLIGALHDGSIDPDSAELAIFLNYLRPKALPALIRSTEIAEAANLRDRLTAAMEGLAREHASSVLKLLGYEDPVTVLGAARLAGRLGIAESVPPLAKLLERPERDVRLAAVEALVALHSGTAVAPLQQALKDESRDVRVAAARGLGALKYAPARKALEPILIDKELRAADLTEKIAFFEAYGAIAGAEGVDFLEDILGSRGLFGTKHPPEIRACAARALGRIGTPPAHAALVKASTDKEALVRNAATSALRKEPSP